MRAKHQYEAFRKDRGNLQGDTEKRSTISEMRCAVLSQDWENTPAEKARSGSGAGIPGVPGIPGACLWEELIQVAVGLLCTVWLKVRQAERHGTGWVGRQPEVLNPAWDGQSGLGGGTGGSPRAAWLLISDTLLPLPCSVL